MQVDVGFCIPIVVTFVLMYYYLWLQNKDD